MKKKILISLALSILFVFMLAVAISAEVTTYNDAPVKTKIQVSTSDLVVFDDGFTCPTGYVFKDQDKIDGGGYNNPSISWAFDFSYVNEKTGKKYTFDNIMELDIPQGVKSIGQYAAVGKKNLKKISIPDSVTSLGGCIFQSATSLEECVFEHNERSGLQTLPNFTFYDTALKAFSMPDCITKVEGNSQFANCDDLGAVYLSKNIITWSSGNQGSASFFNDKNMYFVNQPFTPDNIPTKPEVYYFPAKLESISGETFKTCTNLNSVLVFGEKLTAINHENAPWVFNGCGNTSTIVFLGDMTSVKIGRNTNEFYWSVAKVYFANKNDKSFADVGFSGTQTNGKVVFCNADGNTEHLFKVAVNTPATCVEKGVNGFKCFCGKESDDSEIIEALGHSKTTMVSIAYNGNALYFEKGDVTYTCDRCLQNHVVEDEADALFMTVGYSYTESNVMSKAIMQSFGVNHKAIKAYNDYTENDIVNFGVLAATENGLNGTSDVFGNDGNVNTAKVNVASYVDKAFDLIEMKLGGLEGKDGQSYEDAKLYCCAFIQIKNGEMVESYYATKSIDGATVSTALSGAVSYNDLIK